MTEMRSDSDQLKHWRGEFGDAYVARNELRPNLLAARTAMWSRVLRTTSGAPPASVLEVGCNIGYNLHALRRLTAARLLAVEPNARARATLAGSDVVAPEDLRNATAQALPFEDASIDLAFTSGVLIHIAPDDLLAACREIVRVARRYVVCIEYFADRPEEIAYRGQSGLLFKRDFGAFYLEHFPELVCVDYGFEWKPLTGLDNLTWWLFRKG